MNRRLIITIVSFLASIALVIFVIWPLISSVMESRAEIQEREEQKEALQELVVKTQELTQEYQAMSEEVNKFFLALPDQKEVSYLLVQFENLAISNGLLLESVKFGQEGGEQEELGMGMTGMNNAAAGGSTQTRSFASGTVNISVNGSYAAFKGYLADLEKNIRVMDVEKISFTQQKGDQSSSEFGDSENLASETFQYDLGIKIYYGN